MRYIQILFSSFLIVSLVFVFISMYKSAIKRENDNNAVFTGHVFNSDQEGSSEIGLNSIMSKINKQKVGSDNKSLLNVIRAFYLKPPSVLPYNLTYPEIKDPSAGQTAMIDKYFKAKTGGFFIECGAFDGERLSNSLYLERYRNWTGVLIEAYPPTFKALTNKHRKSYILNVCLSGNSFPKTETFIVDTDPFVVKRVDKQSNLQDGYAEIQCFPLYSILLAMNQLHVDYLSLDMEGGERSVLDSLPWNKITIETLSVEYLLWEGQNDTEKVDNLINYMERKGYIALGVLTKPGVNDVIFRRH